MKKTPEAMISFRRSVVDCHKSFWHEIEDNEQGPRDYVVGLSAMGGELISRAYELHANKAEADAFLEEVFKNIERNCEVEDEMVRQT